MQDAESVSSVLHQGLTTGGVANPNSASPSPCSAVAHEKISILHSLPGGTAEMSVQRGGLFFLIINFANVGTKVGILSRRSMSAFGGKADMPFCAANVR
jgi:hypothetical protein